MGKGIVMILLLCVLVGILAVRVGFQLGRKKSFSEKMMLAEANVEKERLEESLREKSGEIEHLTLQSIMTIANTIDAKDA